MNRSHVPVPFRIGGIPIEINYSWLLIFVLITINLAYRWFPFTIPGLPASIYYILGTVSAVSLFLCVLAHELSHSLAARRAGSEVKKIVLHVFGGISFINEENYTPWIEFRVAMAGPLLSIFLGIFFWGLRKLIFTEPHTIAFAILTYLYFINLSLAIFNLIPAFPLDGGRVLRSLLALRMKDFLKATKWASRIGVAFAFLLMAYGLGSLLTGELWGFWTILIGIFLKEAADSGYRQVLIRDVFRGGVVGDIMQQQPVVVPPDITIQQAIDQYFWPHHFGSFPVGTNTALGILTFKDVKSLSPEKRNSTLVSDLMHPIRDPLRIAITDRIVQAFEKASHNGVGRLIVVDASDRILGYLSLRDISREIRES